MEISVNGKTFICCDTVNGNPMTLLAESFIRSPISTMIHHLNNTLTKYIYSLLLCQFICRNERLCCLTVFRRTLIIITIRMDWYDSCPAIHFVGIITSCFCVKSHIQLGSSSIDDS